MRKSSGCKEGRHEEQEGHSKLAQEGCKAEAAKWACERAEPAKDDWAEMTRGVRREVRGEAAT